MLTRCVVICAKKSGISDQRRHESAPCRSLQSVRSDGGRPRAGPCLAPAFRSPFLRILGAAMSARSQHHRLQVDTALARFIETEALPGTGIEPAAFWQGFDALAHELAPKNAALLAERDRLQAELDGWHRAHPGPIRDMAAYQAFLQQIGYLAPLRSEERRVGKECRSRWSPYH